MFFFLPERRAFAPKPRKNPGTAKIPNSTYNAIASASSSHRLRGLLQTNAKAMAKPARKEKTLYQNNGISMCKKKKKKV